jgi:hypothetical protein
MVLVGEGPVPDSKDVADKPATRRRRDENLGAAILIVVLAAGLYLEESGIDPWLKVVGALVDAAFAVVGVARLTSLLDRTTAKVWERTFQVLRRRVRGAIPFRHKVAGTVIVASVAAAWAVLGMRGDAVGRPGFTGCAEPAELSVLTSTDSEAWVRGLFDAYMRSTGQMSCPTTHVLVFSAPAAPVASAMASGWAANDVQDPLRDIGPRPDLWMPDASADVAEVLRLAAKSGYTLPVPSFTDQSTKRVTVTEGAVKSIGSSPVVVARRGAAARSASVSQALTSAFDAGAGVVAPDPGASTTGRFAMVSYLRDRDGLLGTAPARRRIQVLSGGGVAGTDSLTALCVAGHDAASGAVVTSAQMWELFNAPTGTGDAESPADGCAGGRADFSGWSVAQPDSGVVLDHPLVVPTWTAPNPRQFAAAQRIRDWLAGPAGRSATAAAALSAPVDCVSAGFALDGGFTPSSCLPVDPESVQRLYDSAKVPGRVLMVMDTSGSMAELVPGRRGTRLQLATAAFGQATGQIGGQDELGLWTFPARSDPPHRQLLGIWAGTAQRRTAAVSALRKLKPEGETPLYTTILDGLTVVTTGATAGRTTAVVVLTDGQDTGDLSLDSAREAVAAKSAATGVRLFVVAVGEAACAGNQGLSRLTEGHGACVDADFDHISDTMAGLFESLWKGQ